MRFSTLAGFIIAFGAFVMMLYYLIKTFIYGDPIQGFPTLITIILFLGGIQLLSIGIFGNVWGVFLMKRRVAPLILLEKRN